MNGNYSKVYSRYTKDLLDEFNLIYLNKKNYLTEYTPFSFVLIKKNFFTGETKYHLKIPKLNNPFQNTAQKLINDNSIWIGENFRDLINYLLKHIGVDQYISLPPDEIYSRTLIKKYNYSMISSDWGFKLINKKDIDILEFKKSIEKFDNLINPEIDSTKDIFFLKINAEIQKTNKKYF